MIQNFVWSGQADSKKSRVEYIVLIRPKSKGGFGLISMRAQFTTMARTFILSVAVDGDKTLQHIIRKKIGDLSVVQSRNWDFSWMIPPHAVRPKGETKV